MRVLVTNDDGVHAEGILALAAALAGDGHEVTVVAPLEDFSGSGAALGPSHATGMRIERLELEGLPDVPVIGIDGHELGEVFGLTTIDQDARGQGALAVRRLLARLDGAGDTAAAHTEYPTRFIIRSSTAVPPVDQGPLRA